MNTKSKLLGLQLLVSLALAAVCPSTAVANPPQIQFVSFGTQTTFPLPNDTGIVLNFYLTHDAGTTITVAFFLTNVDGSLIQLGNAETFSYIGQTSTTVYLPTYCLTNAAGWRIFGAAEGQQPINFTTSSYLPNLTEPTVSVAQSAPDMVYGETTTGDTVIVSTQQYASTNQTNLTVNDTIYFEVFPYNIGCSNSTGYVLDVTLNGNEGSVPLNVAGGSYTNYQFSVSGLRAGTNMISYTLVSPNGVKGSSTNKSFFVAFPAAIQAQPTGLTANVGQSAEFYIGVFGTPTPTVQWRFNATNIAGATNTSYTIASVQKTNTGNYSCVVQNYAGSVTSSNAYLQVNVPVVAPTIGLFTISAGGNPQMTFTGAAGGVITVQSSTNLSNWFSISTNTNTTGILPVTLPAVGPAMSSFYRGVVTN